MQISETRTAEGLLSMALIKRKLTRAIGVPRNFGNRQNRIQKKQLLLFPDLQETENGPVVLEFIKIKPEIQFETLDEKITKIKELHTYFINKSISDYVRPGRRMDKAKQTNPDEVRKSERGKYKVN